MKKSKIKHLKSTLKHYRQAVEVQIISEVGWIATARELADMLMWEMYERNRMDAQVDYNKWKKKNKLY